MPHVAICIQYPKQENRIAFGFEGVTELHGIVLCLESPKLKRECRFLFVLGIAFLRGRSWSCGRLGFASGRRFFALLGSRRFFALLRHRLFRCRSNGWFRLLSSRFF